MADVLAHQVVAGRGKRPHITMEMSSNETKQAVMAGMGVTFLSLHTVRLEARTGPLRLLDVQFTPAIGSGGVSLLRD